MKLDPPRWPGGPEICVATNLPAFETEKVLKGWMELNAPECKIERTGKCGECGMWHAETTIY